MNKIDSRLFDRKRGPVPGSFKEMGLSKNRLKRTVVLKRSFKEAFMPTATTVPSSAHLPEDLPENLLTLSAEELHGICFRAHRMGNRAPCFYLRVSTFVRSSRSKGRVFTRSSVARASRNTPRSITVTTTPRPTMT